jgi:predicted lipoprotein with Yx(FWY)xxD motif
MNASVRKLGYAVTVTLGSLLAASCAGAVASSDSVGQVQSTSLGNVLVSPDGMTLYTYDEDTSGVSNCTGLCSTAWPALLAPAGAQPKDGYTLIARSGGEMQWAHNGQPLYLYFADSSPGDVSGDGVDGVWHVATP